MRFVKNAEYDYEKFNIKESNGYEKWFDKERINKKIRVAGTWAQCIMTAAIIGAARAFSAQIKELGITGLIALIAVNVLVLLLVVAPLRRIMHVLPFPKGKLGSECLVSFKKHFSVYNGEITRTQVLISLALPPVVFAAGFTAAAVLTSGIACFISLFLLAESVYLCHADVYMFFYCIENLKKNDKIFGEYKIVS